MTYGTGGSQGQPQPSGGGADEPTVFKRPAGLDQPQQQPPSWQQQPPQPGHGQPPQQQPYGAQPQYGQPPASPYGGPVPARERSFGVTSIVFTVLGVIAAIVGLFALKWLRGDSLAAGLKFFGLRDRATADGVETNWTTTYFAWAALVLLAVTLILAIVAALPTPATPACRALGGILGIVGVAYTVLAPILDGGDGFDSGQYLKHGLGMYVVAGAFLLLAIGALIGSRRRI